MASAPFASPIIPEQLLALFAARDLEALIDAAFDVLRVTVTCDFASAFYRGAGNGLLKGRDSRGRAYDHTFMLRHVELNPAIPLVAANRGIKVLPSRVGLPRSKRELQATMFYRDIMRVQGWRHSAALCFWDEPPAALPFFVVSADRVDGMRDFSEQEVARLERIHPFLACAVDRLHQQESVQTVSDSLAMAVHDGMRCFAILDGRFRLVQASPQASQMCAAWADEGASSPACGAPPEWRLPPALFAVCRELQDEWQAAIRVNPDVTGFRRRRVLLTHDPALTASITVVGPNTAGLAEPTFLLELSRLVHGRTLEAADGSVAVLTSMTPAERAVALVLADGLSNQEIADRLAKTIHAVKFLLHRIYRKTGIPSRAALVAVLRAEAARRASWTVTGDAETGDATSPRRRPVRAMPKASRPATRRR